MKVSTLIKRLETLPSNAEVHLGHPTGDNALFVLTSPNHPNIVWLEGEADICIRDELIAARDHAATVGTSTEDFYAELDSIGFRIEDIRRYLGDEAADAVLKRRENA